MIKKIGVVLIAAVLLLTLPGCWDYVEYEEMTQVSAIGVDYDEKTNKITFIVQEIPTVKAGGVNQQIETVEKTGIVHAATGGTIIEALNKIQSIIAKRIFFGYADTIVIGEEAARKKTLDIIELCDRSPSLRPSTDLFVSASAEETIATAETSKITSSGQKLVGLVKAGSYTGIVFPVEVQDFREMLAIGGLEGVMPHIVTIAQEEVEAKGGTGEDIRASEERSGNQIASGMGVFKGPNFVGYLNEKESRGYGWITNKKSGTFITSETGGDEDTEKKNFYHISKAKDKISVRFENDRPVIDLKVRVTGDLRKRALSDSSDFLLTEELGVLEKKLSDSVRSDIEAALQKCQKEYRSDVFGFGFAVFRKDFNKWMNTFSKEWEDIFPDLQVNVNVESKIINTGTNLRKLEVQ